MKQKMNYLYKNKTNECFQHISRLLKELDIYPYIVFNLKVNNFNSYNWMLYHSKVIRTYFNSTTLYNDYFDVIVKICTALQMYFPEESENIHFIRDILYRWSKSGNDIKTCYQDEKESKNLFNEMLDNILP